MFYREISRILSRYFLYFAAILSIPLGISILYEFILKEKTFFAISVTLAFLVSIMSCLLASYLFRTLSKKTPGTLYRKESILLVALIWFLTAALSALPFYLTRAISNPVDAYFEAMSGLTTTGATILHPKAYENGVEVPILAKNTLDPAITYKFYGTIAPQIDPQTGAILATGIAALGKPLLFWRSFLEWLGGMGIVVLFIAVLPMLSMGGKFLFENEMSGLTKEGVTPRIKETASFLWKVYLGLTLFQILLLLFSNPHLSLFDATTLSFSTISTGGFILSSQGLEAYHLLNFKWILILFMFLGSVNFTLYFHLFKGKIYRLYDPELFLFLVTLALGCLLMTWGLWNSPKYDSPSLFTFSEAFTTGSFQAISSQTSTGFAPVNYNLWPFSCQMLMLILMFIGGMSGSTTGGIKIIRYIIVLRLIKHKIESLFRPESIRCLKIGTKEISANTAMTVLIFFCIVISLTLAGTYLLVLDHNDPLTAFGTIACMINNGGLSLGGLGYNGSFAFLSPFSKLISILAMAFGRLEYFTLLVLFVPAFWKNR